MTTNPQKEIALDDLIKKEKQQKGLIKGKKPKTLSKTLKVENIPLEATEADLYKLFAEKGTLVKCKISTDKFKRSIGEAEVGFEKVEEATQAKEDLNDHEFMGGKLKLKYKLAALNTTNRTHKINKFVNKRINRDNNNRPPKNRGDNRQNRKFSNDRSERSDRQGDFNRRGNRNDSNNHSNKPKRFNTQKNFRNDRGNGFKNGNRGRGGRR